jgi:subtilisin family serine protease
MSEQAADRLAANPQVLSVTSDVVVHAFAQTVPPGISRIGADSPSVTGAGVKVAIIDTGIDTDHPDLMGNYMGGVNFVGSLGSGPEDDNGHGTHVAGTIGAIDNDFGVVGVAPDAHLYAAKVLGPDGSGSTSAVIAGIEWAVLNDSDLINLSLGALDINCLFGLPGCGQSPMCIAVTSAVDAGVTVVAAAGNDGAEAAWYMPANCLHNITVTAYVDTDGSPWGLGNPIIMNDPFVGQCVENDDTIADCFTNWSSACWDMDGDLSCTGADIPVVNMTAPGVAVWSTMPPLVTLNPGPGFLGTLSGTSMATPHVVGAAALFIESFKNATGTSPSPAEVRVALTTGGECVGEAPVGSGTYPFTCPEPWPDDPDNIFNPNNEFGWEPLVNVTTAVVESPSPAPPTTGNLFGIITDFNNDPINRATVTAAQNGTKIKSAKTATDGSYTLLDLACGTYDVTASAKKHSNETQSVDLCPDQSLDFSLTKKAGGGGGGCRGRKCK